MASMTATDYEDYLLEDLTYFARRNGIVCPKHGRTKPVVIGKLTTEATFTQQQFNDFWARDDVRNDSRNPMHPDRPKRVRSKSKKQANARDDEEEEQEQEQNGDENPPLLPSRSNLLPTAPVQPVPAQLLPQAPAQANEYDFMTRTEMNRYVTPVLSAGMRSLAQNKAAKPFKWLSEFLGQMSEELEEGEEPSEESEGEASGNARQGMGAPTVDNSGGSGEDRAPGEEDR
jgi:hypothetical protein